MEEMFGDRLKKLRKEHEMTMDELIAALNSKYPGTILDKSIISRYENNRVKPQRFATVEALAELFGVSVSYLMGKSNDKYGENTEFKKVPILGTIAAGVPIQAQEDIQGYMLLAPEEDIDYCLKIKGNSMINARICDGDIVYIRKQPEVETGEIAAVIINSEEATLKRFYKINGGIILRSENPGFKDIVIERRDMKTVNILGKAVFLKSEVR